MPNFSEEPNNQEDIHICLLDLGGGRDCFGEYTRCLAERERRGVSSDVKWRVCTWHFEQCKMGSPGVPLG